MIGVNKLPLVNEGDALLHIARTAEGNEDLVRESSEEQLLEEEESTVIVE